MAEATTPSPIEAPPPAYELSQLGFDQKLAIAAERSLDISDQRREHGQDDSEQVSEESPEEARRTDASRKSEPQPSVSRYASDQRQTVRPLTFRKKSRDSKGSSGSVEFKERPSWYNEAQLDASASNSSVSGRPLPVPREARESDERSTRTRHILTEDSDEDRSIPPPPFAAVDNSLDGPAYERYATNATRRRRTGGTVVLRYTGEDLAESPLPSPLHPPPAHETSNNAHLRARVASPQIHPANNVYQHAPQQSTLRPDYRNPHPRSAEPQRYLPPPPRLSFDPSVAYEGTQSSLSRQPPADEQESAYNATALYSSAVAPLLSSQKPLPTAPKVRRYTPSVTSLPEYDQPQQRPGVSPGKPFYSVQDYATSRASVYSQSSITNIPQYPHIAQYPQMAQYPTQQNYTRPMAIVQQRDSQRWSTASTPYQSQYYSR